MAKRRAKWGSKNRSCKACGTKNPARTRKCKGCGANPKEPKTEVVLNGVQATLQAEAKRLTTQRDELLVQVGRAESKLTGIKELLAEYE